MLSWRCALNCVSNGILFRENIFDNIWIQPAAGDAGGALGAALSIWHLHYNKERITSEERDCMKGALGPAFTNAEIEAELIKCNANFVKLTQDELIETVATALANEKAVGWMQGHGIWSKSIRWTEYNC